MKPGDFRHVDIQYWADKLMEGRPLGPLSWAERQEIVIAFHQVGARDFAVMARRSIQVTQDGPAMVDCSLGDTKH